DEVEKLILRAMDVQGWSALHNFRGPPHPKRASRLLACGEYLVGIRLLPDRPREARCRVGKHDKSLFVGMIRLKARVHYSIVSHGLRAIQSVSFAIAPGA